MQHTEDQAHYQAAWTPETSDITIVRDIPAGVSGPHGTLHLSRRAEAREGLAAAAERALFSAGYIVTGEWTTGSNGTVWANLTRMG